MPSRTDRPGPPGKPARRPEQGNERTRSDRNESTSRSDRDRRPAPKGPGRSPSNDQLRQHGPGQATRNQSRRRDQAPALTFRGELLYGRNAVAEALRGNRVAHRLLVASGIQTDARVRDMLESARSLGIVVDEVPRELLDDACRGANHQGISLDAGAFEYVMLDDFAGRDGTVLVLDHIQDPQNFGTLLRAAEAVAVAGVVIPQDRAVAVTPAVVNASSGAVEHLQIAQVPNISRALDTLKAAGRWVIGLDEAATSKPLYSTDLPTPTVLVVGAEAKGLGVNVAKRCDLLVSLPMRGKVASLNAATAGSIVLFDIERRNERV